MKTSKKWGEYCPCFNPLPARVRGEMPISACIFADTGVSIRSPRGCAGRCTEARAQAQLVAVSIRSPRGCAGRYAERRQHGRRREVSIRSPRGCAGRSGRNWPSTPARRFQSAPRAGARGDSEAGWIPAVVQRFNPLPARVRGEIMPGSWTADCTPVSIRSPRGCAGRLCVRRSYRPC